MERKYKQKGYQSTDRPEKKKDRPQEPRPRQDQMGPRTPRMVGTVTRARCSNCGAALAPGFDLSGQCPRCNADLHCCKQCVHFDTAAQFECTQPIPERIAKKDARNDCTFFELRVTVEKDTAPIAYATNNPVSTTSERPNDARKAFDNLFKK
jgi:hypothetical protein